MKEMLENYNVYKSEIKSKEYEIRKLELEEASPSSSNLNINGDIRSKGYISSNLENKSINNIDRIKILLLEINELKAKIEMIDAKLDTLKYEEKSIVKMFYCEKKDINIIKSIYGRDEDSIYRTITKCIEKMSKSKKPVKSQ